MQAAISTTSTSFVNVTALSIIAVTSAVGIAFIAVFQLFRMRWKYQRDLAAFESDYKPHWLLGHLYLVGNGKLFTHKNHLHLNGECHSKMNIRKLISEK